MSQTVVIDYRGVAIRVTSACNQAEKQLVRVNELLEGIEKRASTLMTDNIKAIRGQVLAEKAKIMEEIDALKEEANSQLGKGRYSVNSHGADRHRFNQLSDKMSNRAQALTAKANTLTTTRVALIEQLVQDEFISETNRLHKQMITGEKQNIELSKKALDAIDAIEDFVLKERVYQNAREPSNQDKSIAKVIELTKAELKDKAQQAIEGKRRRILEGIQKELDDAQVEKTIDLDAKTDEIDKIREEASEAIISESVRKQTLKIIIKSITQRGFIVDKKNIKHKKDRDEVIVVAQKASGQVAEFRIHLNGRFVYTFDGYEGQACQKDIKPFMKDLEDIYGIEVVSKKEMWSNPDKLSSMKYQHMNTNKGRN
jgi:hypothetical protein